MVTKSAALAPNDKAALSSFGFGGTNIHVVLTGPPQKAAGTLRSAGESDHDPAAEIDTVASAQVVTHMHCSHLLLSET